MKEFEIGAKIKEVFEERGMRLNDFAESIDTVRQNVYKIFQRKSIDTELLWKISQILNHNFFQYFNPSHENYIPAETNAFSSKFYSENDYTSLLEKYEKTEQELGLAHKEIDYLKKIIDLMEERAKLIAGRIPRDKKANVNK